MADLTEIFWNASLEDLKNGYIKLLSNSTENLICLVCGETFEVGMIYQDEGLFYDAERFINHHISQKHGSVFEFLLEMDKKYTGLTDLQKQLLKYFHQGISDQEIVKILNGGSTSTIRNHRFNLREKEKQAKIFLAIMELLTTNKNESQHLINIPRTTKMVDERFAITEAEYDKYIKTYFKEGPNGSLSKFPLKEKRKVIVLKHILKRFDSNHQYTEKEVNDILKSVYPDYVTLRRYLIEYGFMDRKNDGSIYWIKL